MRTSKAVSLDQTARNSSPGPFTRATAHAVQPSRFRQPATTSPAFPASGVGDPLHVPPGGDLDALARSPIMPDFASTRIRQSAQPEAVSRSLARGYRAQPRAGSPTVQRQTGGDPDHAIFGRFGEPYSSTISAMAAETYLRNTLLPLSAGMFNSEVSGLWSLYLSREPGDSLTPLVFNEGSSAIAYAFKHCAETRSEQNALLDEVIANITSAPPLPANQWTTVPLSTFIGATPRQLHTNFSNPYDTPGHIAGGAGSSDAGPDQRFVEGNLRLYRRTDRNGATIEILVEPEFRFRVIDAIDFIPGQPGTGLEQNLTIPLSRLEATGWAYDVPFQVNFTGPVNRRVVSGAAVAGLYPPNAGDSQRPERQREPREPREGERSRGRLGQRDDSRRRDL
jgi:hypothetical protein